MSIISSFIKKFFGSKSDRDIKEVQPYVIKILEEYEKLKDISNDELRVLSAELKTKIQASILNESKQIEEIKFKIEEPEIDIREKERLYVDIEKLMPRGIIRVNVCMLTLKNLMN